MAATQHDLTPATAAEGGDADDERERRVSMDMEGQRAVIQSFALIEGKTAKDAYKHLCMALGSGAMSQVAAYGMFKEFREGRTDYKSQRGENLRNKPATVRTNRLDLFVNRVFFSF